MKEYINNIEIYESPQNKPVYNVDNAFTAALIDFFCRKDTVSHIVLMTSVKRVLWSMFIEKKNPNHRAVCYYAMNNHMYLVEDTFLVLSMVGKARAPEHNIKTSLLQYKY